MRVLLDKIMLNKDFPNALQVSPLRPRQLSSRISQMPIHKESLIEGHVIEFADGDHYREVGYDLSVGKIYVPGEDGEAGRFVEEDSYEIPAQGVVVLFSKERVDVPKCLCGYAQPKTSLCQQGLLVFNTGLLDPGYCGLVSGTTINFQKSKKHIAKGDSFLRVTFDKIVRHEIPPPVKSEEQLAKQVTKDKQYLHNRHNEAIHFPTTFLDVPAQVHRITDEVHDKLLAKLRNEIWMVLACVGLVVSLLFGVARFLIPMVDDIQDGTASQIDALEQRQQATEELLRELRDRLDISPPNPGPLGDGETILPSGAE